MAVREEVKVAYLIKKQVANLLKHFKFTSPPIDVQQVARNLGLEIVEISADIWFDGMYIRFHGRSYIVLNKRMSQAAKRMTLAKGIARHVLEKSLPNWEFNGLESQPQIEYFAHELCVPSEMLKEKLLEQIDYNYLASVFGVTRKEIGRRLKELGLARGEEGRLLRRGGWQEPVFLSKDSPL
jgi:Zn-dependent peptidase ImmA (M78 family)